MLVLEEALRFPDRLVVILLLVLLRLGDLSETVEVASHVEYDEAIGSVGIEVSRH